MKILITGATGFIGSNVMEYLLEREYSVTGCCRNMPEKNREHYILCDLTKEQPNLKADILIHAAAIDPINRNRELRFQDYFNSNIVATKNILEYAQKYGIKKIIYLATVSSFGTVENVLNESSPHNAPNDYGLTKYVAEKLIMDSNIPYEILILPGVVGNGCKDNWIMKTIKTLYANETYEYHNGGGWFNNILDVEDLCVFIEKLLTEESKKSETYLLGSSEKIRVGEMIYFLKEYLQSKSEVVCKDTQSKSFYLDVSHALNHGFLSKPIREILIKVCNQIN